jgi:hypothetical protein
MNFDLKVKEIQKETFILIGKINNQTIINNLVADIKNKKDKDLSYKTNVKGHFTGFKSLLDNIDFKNFLISINKEINIIYQKNFKVVDAWGNILKIGDEVVPHTHGGTEAFSGLLYLSDKGPGTYFKEYDLLITEEIGKFVLFSSMLLHGVSKIEENIERITLSFNCNQLKDWEDNSKLEWVNKNDI